MRFLGELLEPRQLGGGARRARGDLDVRVWDLPEVLLEAVGG